MIARRTLLAAPALLLARHATGQAARTVRIGQATPAVSFLPLAAARARDGFGAAGLKLDWAAISGGDPACLAALDGGDLDFAAVGSETLLNAVGKGQPFQMIFSLMSKVSLELVVSSKVLERTGISPSDDPLPKRLAVLKGLTVGVSAIGGTQDRALRWLARQAGLNPRTEVQVANAGPPPAIQAALEAGRIDAFLLSPPEGLLAEDARTGQVLIRMGEEFPALQGVPSLVLAAKTPLEGARRALAVDTCRVLRKSCADLLADVPGTAAAINEKLFPRIKPPVLLAAVKSLESGIGAEGRFTPAGIEALLTYAGDAGAGLTPRSPFWTNEYVDAAK